MGYLLPADYAAFGLSEDAAESWVAAASAMVEAHCRRASLLMASYTERLRLRRGVWSVRVSYGPLVSVQAAKVRYARRRAGEVCGVGWDFGLRGQIASAFGLSGAWVDLDASSLQMDTACGEVVLPVNELAPLPSEIELTYTAGLAQAPDAVKVACAQIVRNAQAMPALNVKSSKVDALQMEYFSDALIDSQVRALLRPYVAERMG